MRDIKKIDKLLMFLLVSFCVFGLIMIFSASSASTILRYEVSTSHFFKRQLEALIIGFSMGFVVLFIPTSKYKWVIYPILFVLIIILLLVLIKGKISGGAKSWIKLGPINFQPSEFIKIALIVFYSIIYERLNKLGNLKIFTYFIPLLIPVLVVTLIMMEPDMGSAVIVVLITIFTFFSLPAVLKNISKVLKACTLLVIGLALVFMFAGDKIISEEQKSRFNFQSPCLRYTEDTGYQVCNGLIAIRNGGLFGVGLSNSTQKFLYLPESHTDFIFPIICEELGSLTGAIVIIFYLLFLLRIFKIAKEADNLRTSILAYGAFWYFCSHILINLMGILALIPLTGVPLPFLSYGGSYALCSIVMVFIVERVAIENAKCKLTRQMAKIIN